MQKSMMLLVAVAWITATGCTLQKRTLLPGWHVERVHKPAPVQGEEVTNGTAAEARAEWTANAAAPPAQLETSTQPARATATQLPLKGLDRRLAQTISGVQPAKTLQRAELRDTTIQLDRDAELTLTLIGAALLMWSYMPFSIIGFLIVFLASIVGAPLVHALIWGERMDWGKTRLGRVALSLVLSGLVLTGAVALLADVLGLVF